MRLTSPATSKTSARRSGSTHRLHGASYATKAEQAYAARFRQHLHALVIDSGFPELDTLGTYFWGFDYPKAWLRARA